MKNICYFLVLFCFTTNIFAQVYPFKTYNLEQGLPQSEIWDMMTDSRGYLWIGTNGGGLVKFNGKTFQAFTKKDGIPNEQISGLFEDTKNNIWAMTFNGLCRYDGKTFRTYNEEDSIITTNAPFANFAEDEKQNLWVFIRGQQNANLYIYENEKFVAAKTKFSELANLNIIRIFNAKNRFFINAFNPTTQEIILFQYQEGKLTRYINPQINLQINLQNAEHLCPFLEDKSGNLWAATFNFTQNQVFALKLYKISKQEKVTELATPLNMPFFIFGRIGEDKFNNVWLPLNNFVGTGVNVGVLRYAPDGTVTHFSGNNGLPNLPIASTVADRDGNIWLGTRGLGIIKFLGEKFIALNQNIGMQNEIVRTFHQSKNGDVWVGSVSDDLYQWDGKKVTKYTSKLNGGRIMKIEPEEDGSLLLATNGGLIRFKNGQFTKVNTEFGMPENMGLFFYILRAKDGAFWFAGQGAGVFRYDPKAKTTMAYTAANKKLVNNNVYSIFEDKKGNIWMNTNAGVQRIEKKGLLQNEEEKITVFDKNNGLIENLTQQTTEDKNGNIWVTSYGGGVARFDGKKFIPYTKENSELGANLVYSITSDKDGNIWAGAQGCVTKLELDSKSEVTKITNYADNEGFTGKETNGLAIYKDVESNIWFGTLNGAYKYNPKFDVPNLNKPVANITGLRLFFKPVKWQEEPHKSYISALKKWFIDLPENLQLPYNENHVAFDFEAIYFDNPDATEFQWKLEGLDADWTPAIQKNEAVYPNLSPKTYTFKVRAGVKENWGETATYQFTITPPWWKTWWFITICVLIISSLIYSFVRIRIQAIKERQAELEKLVFEKTAEVRQQNVEIMAQAETLQHANSEITRQSEQLAHKNRDITASITYAKRIQTAMLPTETDIQKHLPNCFVLFQPKDIVSGDFYYFEQIKLQNSHEISILAAIDCTGHGVPGAFMSMIGNDLLNHIILEKEIYYPSLILEELNKGVIKSLKQAENKVRDGMDLSLVVINHIEKVDTTLQFAGAMNSIYYVQNGVFKEIKGNKNPIGGYQDNESKYTTHTIDISGDISANISKSTTFWLCTDGYQDQFSETGKKFMVRKFRELLFSIHHLPMQEQKLALQKTSNEWLGNVKQIDDMLVVGVKI